MKSSLFYTFAAILVASLSLPSFGGEWHSSGNSPRPPYFPKTPAAYRCTLTITTGAQGKLYRIVKNHDFRPHDFERPGYGAASLTIAGEEDPGMNGQWISLRFAPNSDGGENVNLMIAAEISAGGQSITGMSPFEAPRSKGIIEGRTSLSLSPKTGADRSVEISVTCKAEKAD